ncbi:MAG TPA: hypothetical protein VM364_09590 [Vicinamibacterales bacterium]|nr:hypothetical protein [Vicinamibacterales bacterium]
MSTLDNLKKEAKRWLKALRANEPSARARLRAAWPEARQEPVLRDLQHALAREHGFESWQALKEAVATSAGEPAEAPADRLAYAYYDGLAHDLVSAYATGDAAALQRLTAHFGTFLRHEDVRARVRERLSAAGADAPGDALSLGSARTVLVHAAGFGDWSEFEQVVAGAPAARPPFAVVRREGIARPRRVLLAREWDALLTAMTDQALPALDARGQMTDALLERLCALPHVTRLDLAGSARVTDAGLRHLVHLPRLESLDLSDTGITDAGLAVLRELPALRTVHLRHRALTDAGLSHLDSCANLERAAIMSRHCTDRVLGYLAGKPRLRHLELGGNLTEAAIPLLHGLPAFATWQGEAPTYALMDYTAGPTYLSLRPLSAFSRGALSPIPGLDGLFGLNLDNPVFRAVDLSPLARLPHFGWLGHDAHDDAMAVIARLPHLRMLMAQDTPATDAGFTALSRSPTLEFIWGRRCYNLTGRGFRALSQLPSLRGLSVSCRNVQDDALATLPDFPSLTALMPMDVQDAGFRHVGRCERLEELWCMYCRETTDEATERIAPLARLRVYYAGATKITDRSLEILGRMPSLERLEFWNVPGVTDEGLKAVAGLPRLRRVQLHDMPRVTWAGAARFPPSVEVDYEG